MRLSSLAVGVMLGIVLLTWLLLRGIGNDGMRYEQALQAFNEFAFAEASLHRDVLQARAGLLLDYDAFSASAAAMKNAVTQLRSLAQTEGLNSGPVDRLASSVVKQVELTEQFKSSNALLQNSLSYVGLLRYRSDIRRPGCAAHACSGRFGGGDFASDTRHLTRSHPGTRGTHRAVRTASAHRRAGCGGGAGTACSCPFAISGSACG